jgi:signal transduction histidine kinase
VDAVDEYSSSLEARVRERTEELHVLQKENTRLRVAEERERIYRDMHDTLGAKLTNIFFCNNVARSALDRDPEKLRGLFDDIESNCQDAVRSLREIVGDAPDADYSGAAFPGTLLERMRRRLAWNGILLSDKDRTSGAAENLDPDAKAELARIFDELVSNVLKHSGADKVKVSFGAGDGMLECSFKDNGRGFDRAAVMSSGSGLSNIDFRVRRLGGILKMRSRLKKGTQYDISVPLVRFPRKEQR